MFDVSRFLNMNNTFRSAGDALIANLGHILFVCCRFGQGVLSNHAAVSKVLDEILVNYNKEMRPGIDGMHVSFV